MIKLLNKLPNKIVVAFSGGVDSTAAVDFLSRKHDVLCAFFHHGTESSERAYEIVGDFCDSRNLTLLIGYCSKTKPKELSTEEFWRKERYAFLESINCTVVTAHTLDDCVETYLFSALHGCAKTIPYQRNNVLRPFLTTRKYKLRDWCKKHSLEWYEDFTNTDYKYTRNYIRHELVSRALVVNPGLHKTVKKLVLKNLSP